MLAYVNVETIPPLGAAPDPDSIAVPGNYKKELTINQYKVAKAYEAYKRMATNPRVAQVFICTLLREGADDVEMLYDMHERDLFAQIEAWVTENPVDTWVTFNGLRFDYPVLWLRALKYGAKNAAKAFRVRNKYGDRAHRDVFLELGGEGGLDEWGRFFGVPNDNPIPGSEVGTCVARGQHDLVVRHAKTRVTVLRDIDKLIRGGE